MYVADFETTTDTNDCRVWAWAICDIDNVENIWYGNTIERFFDFISYLSTKEETIYFHNLKFDGEFILNYLFRHHFTYIEGNKKLETGQFTTLISDTGVFYSINLCIYKDHKVNHSITFLDSYKVLPFKVEEVARTFKLPCKKLEIDYNAYRDEYHTMTKQEKDYIRNDVVIVALALRELFTQGLKNMTTASNAFNNFKEVFSDGDEKIFRRYFPLLPYEIDKDIRQAYKGGFTYLSKNYINAEVGEGITLDVNSLYPSVMYENKLPYGEPIFFNGKYKEDIIYDLYIQCISCEFELKENCIPTIQLKNSLAFIPTQYLESSNGEIVTLYLTNVDLELFFDNYEVTNLLYNNGYKFKSTDKAFKKYIDYWIGVKVQATIDGNAGLRTIAKLMLNSLYGKFGLNPDVRSKIPYLKDGIIKYKLSEADIRDGVYIPVAVFVTAWARNKTIRSAKLLGKRFIYADTDSLHIVGTDIPNNLHIHDTKLGAWKIEEHFTRGKYIRAKTYIEDVITPENKVKEFIEDNPNLFHLCTHNTIIKITCAGMPKSCYEYVTWDNFKEGAEYRGKLKPTHTQGGIVLEETPFTIKAT